jgi:hypothetical protein
MVASLIGSNGVSLLDHTVIGCKKWLDNMAYQKYGSKSKAVWLIKSKSMVKHLIGYGRVFDWFERCVAVRVWSRL